MHIILHISIAPEWQQDRDDMVNPLVELTLVEHANLPGLYELPAGDTYELPLVNGEQIQVWAAYTPAQQSVMQLKYQQQVLLQLRQQGAFHLEIMLPDGRHYQFHWQIVP